MTMKVTIFRKQKDGSESVANEELEKFLQRIQTDLRDDYIWKYRQVFPTMMKNDTWGHIDHIPTVCPVCEYQKNKDGERVMRTFNGVSVLTIKGLNNEMEIEKAKRQASMFPQTLCAMQGADGHSLHVWTLATLPDGTLPKGEKEASLFCAQAYATSMMCYQPGMEFRIDIEEPKLDKRVLLTWDEKPYVNAHPAPFIIEQPTEDSIRSVINMGDPQNHLERVKPSAEAYITFTTMFEAAFKQALLGLSQGGCHNPMEMVTRVAGICADCGLPEEEVATRLVWRYYNERECDVRAVVNNVYAEYKGFGVRTPMSKHQIVAYRLREFLQRRYEIRFNEVLQRTEYRERMSLMFMFKELDRRELNTIHHEACIEGIEPTFGEVNQLVHSNYIPLYNPITEYMNELPEWDGKDRMTGLANMVPNDNPYWTRLFKRWFLSMVAHWMNCDTTHANQTAPVLIGEQGYRKSTFCRLLLPPELQMFFTDSIDFRTNVEAERYLSRFLLVNIDEFDQLSEKQFAFVKHLFQKPVTNIRRMYSETISSQRRYASFIATSNQHEVLRDPTGNRRYICVEVTAPIRTDVSIDYKQLYAQAKSLILSGERYYLNDEDERLIKLSNGDFEVETPIEQLFLSVFSVPENDDEGEWLTVTEIMEQLEKLPTFNKRVDCNTIRLGRVLTKLKLAKRRNNKGYVYFVKR